MTDREILRDLAQRYIEICRNPDQQRSRKDWRAQNSLLGQRPLIYVRAFAWHEMPESHCQCQDPWLRGFEDNFRRHLFWDTLGDDSVFEPWVTLSAVYRCTGWGVGIERQHSEEPGGSFKVNYPLKSLDDIQLLRAPVHDIDRPATATRQQRLEEILGDILPVNVDTAPAYRMWTGDLSTDLGYLRGIEHFMLDMLDDPAGLHRLMAFMRDGVLQTHAQAEQAGDWGLCDHQNQSMPYAQELPDPAANRRGIPRNQLWCYMAGQEFTAVSPAMHDEFLLQYQLPILKHFGLVAYGCCEDLTHKIDILRQIPNLRRIAVSPFADVASCARQIGDRYVVSYRPSPADMVGYGFDPQRIRAILKRDLLACRANNCHVDIVLKDVETVQNDPQRVGKWVELTRQVIAEVDA